MMMGAGATSRWWRGAAVFAVGVVVTSACSSSKSVPPALVPLQSALAGQPDATTQAAVMTLATTLNAEDWGYLIYAQWPDDGGVAALTDPTLQKAANALLAAGTTPGAQAVGAAKEAGIRSDPGGGGLHPLGGLSVMADSYAQWLASYPDAIRLMQNKNGLDYAATPAAAAAFAWLLANSVPSTTPLPNPTQPADGVLGGCGKSFYDGTTLSPACSASDFCCNGEIDFPPAVGRVTCVDFTKCRGSGVIPTLTVQQTSSGDAGESASGSNVCFVGEGAAVDPAEWNAACQALDPQTPNFINCLAADPSLGIASPTLSNGQDPAQVCTVFNDADGQGSTLGVVTGCDPSDYASGGAVTCYCCP
jgi:hypothetical protein